MDAGKLNLSGSWHASRATLLHPLTANSRIRHPKIALTMAPVAAKLRECVQQLRLTPGDSLETSVDASAALARTAVKTEALLVTGAAAATQAKENMHATHDIVTNSLVQGSFAAALDNCLLKAQSALTIADSAAEQRRAVLQEAAQCFADDAQHCAAVCEKATEQSDRETEAKTNALREEWKYVPRAYVASPAQMSSVASASTSSSIVDLKPPPIVG
ncbi:hypothetical protein DIPPA_15095 [Diplonema papillatum]|nr:hypothetical protein DIPPA_15095 [Diplonema papillatum]